jgi:Uri superfamily endonuclease
MKGSYILVISVKQDIELLIGSLGKIKFIKGYYFYIGSAMGNYGSASLENRVKRHLLSKNQKRCYWHIDYLLNDVHTHITRLYLIPSNKPIECRIAEEFSKISTSFINKFGSSDCSCKSHLFYMENQNQFKFRNLNIQVNQK